MQCVLHGRGALTHPSTARGELGRELGRTRSTEHGRSHLTNQTSRAFTNGAGHALRVVEVFQFLTGAVTPLAQGVDARQGANGAHGRRAGLAEAGHHASRPTAQCPALVWLLRHDGDRVMLKRRGFAGVKAARLSQEALVLRLVLRGASPRLSAELVVQGGAHGQRPAPLRPPPPVIVSANPLSSA